MTSINRKALGAHESRSADHDAVADVALTVRIDVSKRGRVGPGKIDLLERIAQRGSISAAARTMGMSYRRAWEIVQELGHCFGRPIVTTQMGGTGGGGATLTPLGRHLVAQYRAIERKARRAAKDDLARLAIVRSRRS